jgi:hypothetical protein
MRYSMPPWSAGPGQDAARVRDPASTTLAPPRQAHREARLRREPATRTHLAGQPVERVTYCQVVNTVRVDVARHCRAQHTTRLAPCSGQQSQLLKRVGRHGMKRRAIADCADLGIVPTLLRHLLRSGRFVPATSAQPRPSGATQLCGWPDRARNTPCRCPDHLVVGLG